MSFTHTIPAKGGNSMCAHKKYKLILYILFLISIIGLISISVIYFDKQIPETITLKENEQGVLDFSVPFTGEITTKTVDGEGVSSINFNNPVRIVAGKSGTYPVKLKLFGFIRYKNITIDVEKKEYVYAGGFPVGIYLKSEGVLVIDTSNFYDAQGQLISPSRNIIEPGDVILEVNANKISSKSELVDYIAKSDGESVIIKLLRKGNLIEVMLRPQCDDCGIYRIGVWVRDDVQGIGTLTYVDEDGNFGALGHGISDADTGDIFSTKQGVLYQANILTIIKGQNGTPGEYVGTIDYSGKNQIGEIDDNCESGIYGHLDSRELLNSMVRCEVGSMYGMHEGEAYILSGTNQDVHQYKIRITDIFYNRSTINKAFEFVVDDEELMNKTNGIVQGMSGSPILQDGKLVGAVTHVFVNDPQRGFGIFIEDMLH